MRKELRRECSTVTETEVDVAERSMYHYVVSSTSFMFVSAVLTPFSSLTLKMQFKHLTQFNKNLFNGPRFQNLACILTYVCCCRLA